MTDDEYYRLLGVSPTATLEEIKKRHRKLAGSLHPDRKGGVDAESQLKAANEAHDRVVKKLLDKQKRDEAQAAEATETAQEHAEQAETKRKERAPNADQAKTFGDRLRHQAGRSRTSSTAGSRGRTGSASSTVRPPRPKPPPPPPRPPGFFDMKPRPPAPEPEFQQENDSPFLSLLEDIVLPIVQFIVGGLGLLVGGFLALWAVVIGILLVIAAVVGASWLFLLLLGYVGGH